MTNTSKFQTYRAYILDIQTDFIVIPSQSESEGDKLTSDLMTRHYFWTRRYFHSHSDIKYIRSRNQMSTAGYKTNTIQKDMRMILKCKARYKINTRIIPLINRIVMGEHAIYNAHTKLFWWYCEINHPEVTLVPSHAFKHLILC